IFISRHARITRQAISPLFAMSILLNIKTDRIEEIHPVHPVYPVTFLLHNRVALILLVVTNTHSRARGVPCGVPPLFLGEDLARLKIDAVESVGEVDALFTVAIDLAVENDAVGDASGGH